MTLTLSQIFEQKKISTLNYLFKTSFKWVVQLKNCGYGP